jgi:hypothetical protein
MSLTGTTLAKFDINGGITSIAGSPNFYRVNAVQSGGSLAAPVQQVMLNFVSKGGSGSSGTSGTSGSSGTAGTSGSSGTAGSSGTSGSNGSSGTSGSSGSNGSSGTSGSSGSNGSSGTSGSSGSTGTSGTAGTSGSSGTAGSSGTSFRWKGLFIFPSGYSVNDVVNYNNSSYICILDYPPQSFPYPINPAFSTTYWSLMAQAGSNGTSGSSGTSGSNGSSGTSGSSGSNGSSGTSGSNGTSGSSGTSGSNGSSGTSGSSGSSGTSGAIGATGSSGSSGTSGSNGSSGTSGTIGATGSSGTSGTSFTSPYSGSLVITGSIQGNVNALSIASQTASLNLNNGNFFTLQLVSGSATHILPSNIRPGQTINIRLNTTGSGTVTFPSFVDQVSGSSYIPSTTTSVDIITLISFDSSSLYLANIKNLV